MTTNIKPAANSTYEQTWDEYCRWWDSTSGLSKQYRYLGDEWGDDAWVESNINSFVRPYLSPESSVLEIGPGGGRYTASVADHCNQLIGVDVSSLMIERLRDRFDIGSGLIFFKSNGHDLSDVPDNHLDFVFSFNVFVQIEFEDIVSYLAEIKRVLKPGGKAAIHYATISHKDGWEYFQNNCRAWTERTIPRGRFSELTLNTMDLLAERFSFRLLFNQPVARDAVVVLEKPRTPVVTAAHPSRWEPYRTTVSYPILLPKATNLFFLVGNMRSGTTWLMDLLNTHPDFCCVGEMHAVETPDLPFPTLEAVSRNAVALRHWYLMSNNGWSNPFQTGSMSHPHLEHDLVRFMFEWTIHRYLQSRGGPMPRFIGDKSPTHTRSLVRRLRAYFGVYEPYVLHLVRDPRDVAVSRWLQQRKRQNLGQFTFAEPFRSEEDKDACANLMADPEAYVQQDKFFSYPEFLPVVFDEWADVNSGLSRDGQDAFGERYLRVKYEDLKADLAGTLQHIFQWFGANRSPSIMNEVMEKNDVTKMTHKKETFRKGTTGEWKTYFSPQDVELFRDRVLPVSKQFGYV